MFNRAMARRAEWLGARVSRSNRHASSFELTLPSQFAIHRSESLWPPHERSARSATALGSLISRTSSGRAPSITSAVERVSAGGWFQRATTNQPHASSWAIRIFRRPFSGTERADAPVGHRPSLATLTLHTGRPQPMSRTGRRQLHVYDLFTCSGRRDAWPYQTITSRSAPRMSTMPNASRVFIPKAGGGRIEA